MAINEIVATVSLIMQIKAGAILGSATGFFYSRNDDLFLVTNQHVVRDDKKNVFPDTLRLRLHLDSNDITKNEDFDVTLYAGTIHLWKTHPKFPDADIAVLKIDKTQIQGKFFIRAWAAEDFLPPQYALDPGEDIFVMGYPLGVYDNVNNLPIFRNAMVASAYGVPFQGSPLFLTDANLHPGTSGSPVITKPKNAWVDDKGNTNLVTGKPYYLVGVHSATLGVTPAGQAEIQLGLGAAWYANLIEEIVAQF